MANSLITIVDTSTGEEVTRPRTADEEALYKADLAAFAAQQTEPTLEEKLASVGLSIPELKAALGL
jgi:hypothetical protein